jgi:hypothetical protein
LEDDLAGDAVMDIGQLFSWGDFGQAGMNPPQQHATAGFVGQEEGLLSQLLSFFNFPIFLVIETKGMKSVGLTASGLVGVGQVSQIEGITVAFFQIATLDFGNGQGL